MFQGEKLTKKLLLILFGLLLLAGYALVCGKCIIKAFTGIPCPGCGMSRAYGCLLHLDLAGAFYYHPLFWAIPIIFAFAIACSFGIIKNKRIIMSFSLVFTVLFLAVYVYRLATLFPEAAPMDFDSGAVIPSIIKAVLRLL